MATVSSVLIESTTISSSAQATDFNAPSMSAASLPVMTVTERFGTGGVYYCDCRTIAVPVWIAPAPALVTGPPVTGPPGPIETSCTASRLTRDLL